MVTGKRILVALAALALVAGSPFADQADAQDVEQASYSTARMRPSTGRHRITVWRGGRPTLASTALQEQEAEMPPEPDDGEGQVPWASEPETVSPFLDESRAHAGGCATGNCGDGSCDGGECATCAGPCVCGRPWWAHRTHIFGEYLYLHPTGVDMAHAIQQNGTGGSGTTPEGRVGVVDQNYNSAYRVGFGVALGPCASIVTSYANYHSHATDSLSAPDVLGGTVGSLVLHPESLNAGSTSFLVDAFNDIDFQTVDVDYRRLLGGGYRYFVNYAVGVRYAKLVQEFGQIGEFAPPTGTIETTTDISFEGAGLRAGLDGEQRLGGTRLGVYGKGFINVLFGRFNSNYLQFDLTTDSIQSLSSWKDERVVPVLEYEVGLSWTSRGGHIRATAGYYTAFWFNAVTTPEYVQAVQYADFVNVGDTIAFDGLVSRLEFRY
jgi:hypothetical protein